MIEIIRNAYLHPDEAIARIKEILDQKLPVTGEEVAMRGGRTCLRNFIPLYVDGKSQGRLWHHWDITERKRAEDALREARTAAEQSAMELQTVLDIAPVAIWIAHDPLCLRITGNRYADESIMQVPRGANISASAAPEDVAVTFRVFRDGVELKPEELPAQVAASTGKPVADEVLELRFSDGRVANLFEGAVPLFDAAGHVRGTIATAMDVTPIKTAEEALREARRRLEVIVDSIADGFYALDRQWRLYPCQRCGPAPHGENPRGNSRPDTL